VALKGLLDTIKMISNRERMNDTNMSASVIDGECCDNERPRETIDAKREQMQLSCELRGSGRKLVYWGGLYALLYVKCM